ncbi:MAG: hypothetical protein ORN28_07760, partial [Rhodoferax sp.]|nr:hypothetical protein [Rhodoferax sp.]
QQIQKTYFKTGHVRMLTSYLHASARSLKCPLHRAEAKPAPLLESASANLLQLAGALQMLLKTDRSKLPALFHAVPGFLLLGFEQDCTV